MDEVTRGQMHLGKDMGELLHYPAYFQVLFWLNYFTAIKETPLKVKQPWKPLIDNVLYTSILARRNDKEIADILDLITIWKKLQTF